MGVQAFVSFAVAEFADQARKEEPNISDVALIRQCVQLAKEAIAGEDGLAAQAAEQAPDFARKIGRTIDFKYWCQLSSWSPEEAAFLALGLDPQDVRLIGYADAEVCRRYERLRRVAERYVDAGKDRAPAPMYRHMKRFEAEFPTEISVHLKANRRYLMRYERKYKNVKKRDKKFARHRDTYLKLIYALAVDRFKYSQKHRTDAVGNIRKALSDLEMTLTPKPIRAILNLAVDRYKFLKKTDKIS